MRKAEIKRKTGETDIKLQLNLDGKGESKIESGCGFLDHMLTLFAKHGRFDLNVKCKGDTFVDYHHTVEDIGICLGQAVKDALNDVNEKGYGIVMPDISDLVLEEPEIVRQSGGYGVRLRASARSVHMIKANIETEINPIVGTEQQSEDLIRYLLREFEEDPKKIWSSNLFGKTLYELITEGLHSKLDNMPDDAREKLGGTLERIINEGSGGLICILL